MLDHGLEKPDISIIDDEVVVTLYGPGEDLNRIRVLAEAGVGLKPSIEARLNDRQKAALEEAVLKGAVTSGWVCESQVILALPGAQYISVTFGDFPKAAQMACSLPPAPITSTFILFLLCVLFSAKLKK